MICIAVCGMTVAAHYAGFPVVQDLAREFVAALGFIAIFAAVLFATGALSKWRAAPRVARPFRALSEEQQRLLLEVQARERTWFKGYAEDQRWFKELLELGYLQPARPMIRFLDGEPDTYELTPHGRYAVDRAAQRRVGSRSPKLSPGRFRPIRLSR